MPVHASTIKRVGLASVFFACLFIGLVYLSSAGDPCSDQVLAFARSSPDLAAELGPVQDVSVRRRVTVQDAISVSDQFVPGYRSYDLLLKGSRASALVRVRTGLKDCSPRITSMDRG